MRNLPRVVLVEDYHIKTADMTKEALLENLWPLAKEVGSKAITAVKGWFSRGASAIEQAAAKAEQAAAKAEQTAAKVEQTAAKTPTQQAVVAKASTKGTPKVQKAPRTMTKQERKIMKQAYKGGYKKGLQAGSKAAYQEGMEEGMKKGLRQGIEEGTQKGLKTGRWQGAAAGAGAGVLGGALLFGGSKRENY